MKRRVTVEFDLDTQDYNDADDTQRGTLELAKAILVGEADWPDAPVTIKVEGKPILELTLPPLG